VKKIQLAILMMGLGSAAIILSGCNVGPTYGTGKSAGQQLMDDVSSIASLRSSDKTAQVETRPRPDLVPPAPDMRTALPPPQESLAQAGTSAWPESPEERRLRLRDEATANQDNPNYVSPIEPEKATYRRERPTDLNRAGNERISVVTRAEERKQREAYRKAQQENSGGTATQRKYLSEPPLTYRQPADTAPTDDIGISEAEKERKRKAALSSSQGKKRWWPF